MRNYWQTNSINEVVEFFAKGFKPHKKGEEIASIRYYIDTKREAVIFDLLIREVGDSPGLDNLTGGPGVAPGLDYSR